MDINKNVACCFTGHRPERLEMSEEVESKLGKN